MEVERALEVLHIDLVEQMRAQVVVVPIINGDEKVFGRYDAFEHKIELKEDEKDNFIVLLHEVVHMVDHLARVSLDLADTAFGEMTAPQYLSQVQGPPEVWMNIIRQYAPAGYLVDLNRRVEGKVSELLAHSVSELFAVPMFGKLFREGWRVEVAPFYQEKLEALTLERLEKYVAFTTQVKAKNARAAIEAWEALHDK